MGTENYADESCEGGFGEVEAVADEAAEESVDQEEGGDDQVGEVCGRGFEVFGEPGAHAYGWGVVSCGGGGTRDNLVVGREVKWGERSANRFSRSIG